MTKVRITTVLMAVFGGALSLAAADRPSVLAQAAPGLWEVSGSPGAKAPVRQCFADLQVLARFEHRAETCSTRITSDNGASEVIEYRCGAAGFGRSQVDLVTPRSLRIQTQGISSQLPFNYVIQARRVGDCTGAASPPHHS